jgi:hypothetical protein
VQQCLGFVFDTIASWLGHANHNSNTIPKADKNIKPVDTVEGANRALGTPNFEINTISLESNRF